MTQKWDLQPVIDLAIAYNSNLAVADIQTPRMWVNEGCDIILNAVPAMSEVITWAKKHGKRIGSYSYFTEPVRKARDKRLQEVVTARKEASPEGEAEKQLQRAKKIAWARDKQIKCVGIGPADFRWLEEFEQKHGRIAG